MGVQGFLCRLSYLDSNFLAAQEDRELQMAIEASKREVSMRSDLPSGWEEKRDPSTGKYFYIDHVNKRTQWDKPKVLPDPSMPPAYDDCVPSTSKPETNDEQNADVSSLLLSLNVKGVTYLRN